VRAQIQQTKAKTPLFWLLDFKFWSQNGIKEGFSCECFVYMVEEEINESENLFGNIACILCFGGSKVYYQGSKFFLPSI